MWKVDVTEADGGRTGQTPSYPGILPPQLEKRLCAADVGTPETHVTRCAALRFWCVFVRKRVKTEGKDKEKRRVRRIWRAVALRASVVCTGCVVGAETVLCHVSCVFFAWSAAVCHCATEGTRLPTLRGDTRSRRATHTLLRLLQALHSGVPRLSSILTVNSWMGHKAGHCVNLTPRSITPHLGPQMWVGAETVWPSWARQVVSTGSRPGLSGTKRTSFIDSRPGGD